MRCHGVSTDCSVDVRVMSSAPQPVTRVHTEMVVVAVVIARLRLAFTYSLYGASGTAVTAARLSITSYDKVVVQTLAVAVSQRSSSGSGSVG